MNNKTFDFLDLFIEAMEEKAEESLKTGAADNSCEISNLEIKLKSMLREYKKDIKILEGRITKKKFLESIQSQLENPFNPKILEGDFALAYRKNLAEDETNKSEEDLQKLITLKKIRNTMKKDDRETDAESSRK